MKNKITDHGEKREGISHSMTFREWLLAQEGKFVNIYSKDMAMNENGETMPAYGRLRVHADFVEVTTRNSPIAVLIDQITCVTVVNDQEKCMWIEMEKKEA